MAKDAQETGVPQGQQPQRGAKKINVECFKQCVTLPQ